MELKIVARPALTVIGMQIHTTPMSPEIPALWPKFVARMQEISDQTEPDVSYGVMRNLDEGMTRLDYVAAVAARAADEVPQGMISLTIPAGTYALFAVPLSEISAAFGEIFHHHLPASDYVLVAGPYFERYDEAFDPADPHSTVEICLPVRAKANAA